MVHESMMMWLAYHLSPHMIHRKSNCTIILFAACRERRITGSHSRVHYPYPQRAGSYKAGCAGPSAKAATNNGITLSEITSTAKGNLISATSEALSINIFTI